MPYRVERQFLWLSDFFFFFFVHQATSGKESTRKGKNLFPWRANHSFESDKLFTFRVDPLSEMRQNNLNELSPLKEYPLTFYPCAPERNILTFLRWFLCCSSSLFIRLLHDNVCCRVLINQHWVHSTVRLYCTQDTNVSYRLSLLRLSFLLNDAL